MSELPPQQPRPESQKIIVPDEFTDEEKRRFGGTSYHSYEDYDERAGAQAEREYAEGDKGPEPAPDASVPSPEGPEPEEDLDETLRFKREEREKIIKEAAEKARSETGSDESDEERRARIMHEIDEADAMNRPTKRMKTLKRIAYQAQADGDLDLAIEAASRIRTSKTRKKGGVSQLWIRNTLAHDQVMRDLAEKIDPEEIDDRLKTADRIKFGYKRNPVMARIIGSVYEEAHESFKDSWEDDGRELEKEAQKLSAEKLYGWRSGKYFGETIARWAILRKDPELLTSLGGIRYFLTRRRAKKIINKDKPS